MDMGGHMLYTKQYLIEQLFFARLFFALQEQKLDVAERLVANIADINQSFKMGGKYTTLIHHFSACGNLEVVRWLAEKGANLNQEDEFGEKPLLAACLSRNTALVRWLIEEQKVDLNLVSNTGQTPLSIACSGGDLATVQCLVKNGVSLHQVDAFGQTPLHWACSNGWLPLAQWLVGNGVNLHQVDGEGKTALFSACLSKNLLLVQWLVYKGLDFNQVDNSGQTPVFSASSNGNLNVVQWLVRKGVNLNQQDNDGQTPLHVSLISGEEETARWLLGRGAAVTSCIIDDWEDHDMRDHLESVLQQDVLLIAVAENEDIQVKILGVNPDLCIVNTEEYISNYKKPDSFRRVACPFTKQQVPRLMPTTSSSNTNRLITERSRREEEISR